MARISGATRYANTSLWNLLSYYLCCELEMEGRASRPSRRGRPPLHELAVILPLKITVILSGVRRQPNGVERSHIICGSICCWNIFHQELVRKERRRQE